MRRLVAVPLRSRARRALAPRVPDARPPAAAARRRSYLSNSNDYTVRSAYDYDPCDCSNGVNALDCVNTSAACARVLGLEAAFWTTDFDASQLENGLWPRAAAMAEVRSGNKRSVGRERRRNPMERAAP